MNDSTRQANAAPDQQRKRVRGIVEEELARVDSPETAEEVLRRIEALAADETEAEAAEEAEEEPAPAAQMVERAATRAPQKEEEVARVLTTTAGEAVAERPEAPAVLEGAQEALGTRPTEAPAPPETERGRRYLKDAALRHMSPLEALDARLYLAINLLPHPRWLDQLANAVTMITTGGWIWAIAVWLAGRFGVRRTRTALRTLLPSLGGATWVIEHPIKTYFRRRRPFVDIVRALVVGKRPGSWSFPSGHTGSSFAAAWMLTCIWPRRGPLFFALASCVGFSRVYVGAHYPGDVMSGALAGVVCAEGIRRFLRFLLR